MGYIHWMILDAKEIIDQVIKVIWLNLIQLCLNWWLPDLGPSNKKTKLHIA